MALADFAAYRTAYGSPRYVTRNYYQGSTTTGTGADELGTLIRDTQGYPTEIAIPTTSVALSRSSDGSLWSPTVSGRKVITGLGVSITNSSGVPGMPMLIVDRLVHSGGLTGNATTVQTTNLPTAALTRNTDGVGVFAALLVWSSSSSTDLTVDVTYTNSDSTSGRVSRLFTSDSVLSVGVYPIPYKDGDVGVKSVESIQLTATIGTPNLGIGLFKPYMLVPGNSMGRFSSLSCAGWNNDFPDDMFLEALYTDVGDPSSEHVKTFSFSSV